ncbi:unnamed protein product [Protopolystoma xenopodis]|uniref:Uncharacterized protein n=1 Tax=Protopolystoma xenopodis TaxID=117903 RepID=A0A448XL36_9PLAT|nr:unnamed protein product [Protopolystoma xenopodis]
MGGITGFSSLLSGHARLDASGSGMPEDLEKDSPITNNDHPFLRSNAMAVYQHKLTNNDPEGKFT